MSRLTKARRTLAIGLAVLLVMTIAAGVLGWTQVNRTLPTTSGTIVIDGLTGSVEIRRDERGVPHIYADSMGDLMRAQGFVHAQDRFFQMDLRRLVTSGRLSELVGEAGVESDRMIRTMGWRRVAEEELPLLKPETRQALQAYADGVNAWLATQPEPADVALEYSILGLRNSEYRIADWTPADSLAWLKAMAWDLKGNYQGELTRAVIGDQVSAAMIKDLYPPYPGKEHAPILGLADWRPSSSSQTRGPSDVRPERATHQVDPATEAGSVPLLRSRKNLEAVPALLGRGEAIGSNSWVVSGSRSSTGKPLLANDPHLAASMPGVWYQVGLHCRTVSEQCPLDVTGFSMAGMPAVTIGHNQRIAWGLTNLSPDVTDFYLERFDGDTYLRDGRYEPVVTREETITVAGGEDVPLTIRQTVHGPVISDVSPLVASSAQDVVVGKQAPRTYDVSMAWTALTPGKTADALFGFNAAQNWDEFREAAKDLAVPSQNLVYADVDGHIGYQAPGLIPIRRAVVDGSPPGYVPAPGWLSEYDWQGFVPFEDLPWVLDPEDGFIVAANQQVTPSATPFLTTEWDYGYRSQRIRDLLTSEPQVTPAKMARIQIDDGNDFAPVLVSALMEVPLDDPFVDEARDLLKDWDYTQPTGPGKASAAAIYYNAVWAQIVRLTFNDELPIGLKATGGSRDMASVALLLEKPTSAWWDNRETPGVIEGRDEVLRQALTDARLELTQSLGKNPSSWRWDRVHELELTHPVLGTEESPALIRRLFNRGPYGLPGGPSIINANAFDASQGFAVTAIPSMRMVVDLGDLDASRWVNATGQSGRPMSDHYVDQVDAWAAGETFPWPSSREAVEEATSDVLTLEPKATTP